ncbi:MAG TPA: type II toxin-antitoxin system VapC family toxin [Puia sp.]|nr:type II toxin-antitoxin system VapC family toxin [Puia sp.]
MAFRVFLNQDVLLDFTLKGNGYKRSRELLTWAVNGRIQAYVTPAVLQEAGRRLRQAYGASRTRELLLALLADVNVIDAGHSEMVSALHSTMGERDDALSYYAALNHKLDYFITNDKELSAVAVPTLPVCTSEEFLTSNR